MTNPITDATIEQLLAMMHSGTRAETKAANGEYWARVEAGAHTRPAAVDVIAAHETPAAFTRRQLAKLEG